MSTAKTDLQHAKSRRGFQDARVVASLAALIAAALLIVAAAVYGGSLRQDALEAESERKAVALSVRNLEKSIATNVRDYAWWNDSVQYLVLNLDEAWADLNVGPYVSKTFGYDVALVVTGDGRPRIGWRGEERATDAVAAALGPKLPNLLMQARVQNASEPRALAAILPGRDGLYVAAASPIVPQPGARLTLPGGPPALLIFAKRLDESFLQTLREDFGLRTPRFVSAGALPSGFTGVDLEGPTDEVVARIAWQPRHPGRNQLYWLIPALLGSLVVFSVFTRFVLASIRRSTAAIRESENRFRDIAEATSDWIWETDRRLRLTYVSEHFARETGLTPAHVLDRPLHEVLELPDQKQIERQQACLMAGQPFRDVPCLLQPSSGETRTLRVAGKPVHGAGGTLLGYRGTATDITAETAALREVRALEQQALERLAAAKTELERLNAELEHRVEERTRERELALAQLFQAQKVEAVGKLTGGVAHDFNNLLMAMLTNLDLLKRRLADDSKGTALIDGAIQAAERGATLTQRLLAFARRQDLQPRTVDLPHLVQGLSELIQRSVGPLVSVRVEAMENLPPARVDPNQLELALLNLAVNARDAMLNGGALTVAIGRENIDSFHPTGLAPGAYLRIDVADTGIGMDAVTLRRAVEPFFTTKGPGKGTGLGLSMVHGLAAQSGGALHLASRPDEGTTASLWLPCAEADRESVAAPEPMTDAHRSVVRPASVLVVDDDTLVRMGTVTMLEELGHTVEEADCGEEALQILRERPDIDLVVTDYAMPGMTGLALTRAIRELRPNLPVVLATGYAELPEGVPADLPRLGKPYRMAELAARLGEMLPWTCPESTVVPLVRRRPGGRAAWR